jgi:hypothetical protein
MREWLASNSRNRAVVAGLLGVVVLAGGIVAAIALAGGNGKSVSGAESSAPATSTATATATPADSPTAAPTPIRFAGILDGVPMSEAEWDERKDLLPVAVMIDNTPDAFPQAGLDKADVVYEAFVEGGITRLMGVFWRRESDYLVPVRSARTPFITWVDELGALYGHAGQAATDNDANASGQLEEWKIFDLNAFLGVPSNAYYREPERFGPHDLVTSTLALRDAAEKLGYAGPPTVAPWLFKANGEGTSSAPPAGGIEVNFQAGRYSWQLIQWHWDAAAKSYERFQFGGAHIDAKTKEPLHFTNVVVMRVPSEVVDEAGHVLLEQFGSGPATVFLDGKQVEGTWSKADRKARTRFYDAQGSEIRFNRGSTFIEVIGLQSTVTVAATAAGLPAIPPYEPPPPGAPADAAEETPTVTGTPPASVSPGPAGSATAVTGTPSPGKTPTAPAPTGTAPSGPSATVTAAATPASSTTAP